jgi:hypothetical protein
MYSVSWLGEGDDDGNNCGDDYGDTGDDDSDGDGELTSRVSMRSERPIVETPPTRGYIWITFLPSRRH